MKYEGKITKKLNGHRECWRNDQLLWISIPKNANMQFRQICERAGAIRSKLEANNLPDTIFCVWRNPTTRLISGIGEYSKRMNVLKPNKEKYTQYLEQLLKDPYDFDEHLEPQIVYA